MISKRCTYSLQSLVYLSWQASEGYVPMRRISDALSIPASYLAKILAELAARHYVTTRKGPQGGAMLQSDPRVLTVRDIVVAIDGPGLFEACVLGLPGCGRQTPCPMHGHWADTRAVLSRGFAALTINQLAGLIAPKELEVSFFTSF